MIRTANNPDEYKYYDLVREALENEFKNKGYCVDFEVTGYPPRKRVPERFLCKNELLRKYVAVLPTPDIMGLVWQQQDQNKKLVIAEFKQSPRFRHIFQTKGYDELFKSDFAFLVGAEAISESSKSTMAYVRNDRTLLETKCGKSQIYVYFLHKTSEGAITLARLGTEVDLPDIGAELC